jgi:hypothetical protein
MSVGYKLTREIRDFAPPDLTSGELVVALMIADDANDRSRRSWIPLPLLCARARLKPSSVRAALSKLAARGYEFRVIHGYGKDGRPMFAVRGHTTDFVVPDMLKGASPVAPNPVDNPSIGASAVAPNGSYPQEIGASAVAEGASRVAPKSEIGASALAPLSSKNLNHLNGHSTKAVDRSVCTPVSAEVIHRQETESHDR